MSWFSNERDRWASPFAQAEGRIGLPGLNARDGKLYGQSLPRGLLLPRFAPDRPPVNYWMRPHELATYGYVPGQIILGKLGDGFLGYLDDRPQTTVAGARAGKTSTVLEPNLYLWPGSCLVLDPKGELSRRTARVRQALGHDVYVLDPFGQSGEPSAGFNALAELDPNSRTIIDDVASIAQAIVVDDGDSRAAHWNNSARTLLQGLILLTLSRPKPERNLLTVRQMLTLRHPHLIAAVQAAAEGESKEAREKFYNENKMAVETLLGAMARAGSAFGGVLAAIGNRFLSTPSTERGSIFSTAAVQTDFLDSLPMQAISKFSSFPLSCLRAEKPATIYLVLPVGRMETHFRWLRLIIQLACVVLEQMGTYPRDRAPILFMMEEFATLGHMDIMERAAAYFPGFGIKLWVVLQDIGQLNRHYPKSAETFLGNAGLVQCFANSDQPTLEYLTRRLEKLIQPFELRTAFARRNFSQLLLIEGEAPAAAMRLEHEDVMNIRAQAIRWAMRRQARSSQ